VRCSLKSHAILAYSIARKINKSLSPPDGPALVSRRCCTLMSAHKWSAPGIRTSELGVGPWETRMVFPSELVVQSLFTNVMASVNAQC
jgi:hypothetical protein